MNEEFYAKMMVVMTLIALIGWMAAFYFGFKYVMEII